MSGEPEAQYLVGDRQGNIYGPADAAMLRQWVEEGRIVAGMVIAHRQTRQWIEASQHPVVADLLAARAAGAGPAGSASVENRSMVSREPAGQEEWSGEFRQAEGPAGFEDPRGAAPRSVSGSLDLPYATPPTRKNVLGIIGFICGVVSPVTILGSCAPMCACVFLPVALLLAIAAIVLSAVGLHQCKRNPDVFQGRGLALAGLVLGISVVSFYGIGMGAIMVMRMLHP